MFTFSRAWAGAIAVLGALVLLPTIVFAHAHLVRADLAPDSDLRVPGGTVRFWFDESLNPALSRIAIRNAGGRQVNTDTGRLNPGNAEELDLQVPALPAGQYSVLWTSDSAQDGHILHGFYLFTAGGTGARAISVGPAALLTVNQPTLDGTAVASALAHWLVLLASTVWTGALALEMLVLGPARRPSTDEPVGLAAAASARIVPVVAIGVLATTGTSLLEIEAQAYAAEGWAGLTSSGVVGGILHSHYGTFWLLRMLACALTLVVLASARRGAVAVPPDRSPSRHRELVPLAYGVARALGLAYLLALALSGHAAALPQLVLTSVLLDWLHLLANAVWIGGMGAIALVLVPALLRTGTQGPHALAQGRAAFLALLDRFSPAAYIALATAAATGMFNAQVHLSALDQLIDTAYGRFLLIKLALIVEIMALSASHVFLTRPQLRRAQAPAGDAATLDAGFGSLIGRLRIEPLLGALILLCVALMGQAAPAVTVFSDAASASPGPSAIAVPTTVAAPTIRTTIHQGLLDVSLTVDPAAVGRTRLTATVRQRGRPVADAQVRLRLGVPGQPGLGATFVETVFSGGGYRGAGDLVQAGEWQVDVLVRTRDDPGEFRDVPFTFLAGPDAAFLAAGLDPAAVTLAVAPGRLDSPNTVTLGGIRAPAVRLVSSSLDMEMGAIPANAAALGGGRWRVADLFAPMNGRWALDVQVEQQGGWRTLRQFVYTVPLSGPIALLGSSSTATGAAPATPADLSRPFNVAMARSLPYTALVTEMGSNGVRRIGGSFVRTGLQAHGVDVLDGTPYAYITNFGADPGTVSQIDLRTMRVVRTFTVGLGPAHIIFTADHRRAFVTDFRTSDLYVLDLRSGATLPIAFPDGACFEPHGIDIAEDGRTLFVACAGGAWIYTVDTRTLRPGRMVITGPGAFGVAVDAPRHEVWVTNQTANSVSVVDERTLAVLATIVVGKGPALLVPTPDGRTVYVADQLGNQVSVIDAARRRIIATIPVAAQPHGPDVTADGRYVYVASIGGDAVTIIRTADNRVVAVVPAAIGSNEVAIAH